MASQVVKFAGLSDRDRKKVSSLPKLAEGDRVELHVWRLDGRDQTLSLPPAAISVVETLLTRLLNGERVAVVAEDQELSPTEAFPPSSASHGRWLCCGWIVASCRFVMSANTAARRSRTCWR